MSVIMEVGWHGFDHKKDVEKSPFFTGFPLTYSPFQSCFFFFFSIVAKLFSFGITFRFVFICISTYKQSPVRLSVAHFNLLLRPTGQK